MWTKVHTTTWEDARYPNTWLRSPVGLACRDRPAEGAGRPGGGRAAGPRPVPFDGLSDEWRLAGQMRIEGRLSDALNRRNPIELTEMRWASLVDGGPRKLVHGVFGTLDRRKATLPEPPGLPDAVALRRAAKAA